MGENSKIEWCDHTHNFWVGCTKVSAACDCCYAETWAKRSGNPKLWQGERRRTTEMNWKNPFKWDRHACGYRAKVFTNSLADFFDNQVLTQWRDDAWKVIKLTAGLDWLILTKRPQNIEKMLPADWGDGYPNVWLGTTVETGTEVRRIAHLLRVPALVHFLSCEPLLSAIDIAPYLSAYWTAINCPQPRRDGAVGQRINWVIVGGESGPKARPMHPDWVRSLREQCAAAGVAFFFKQWGEWLAGEGNHGQFDARPMHAYRRVDDHSYEWPPVHASHSFDHVDPWSGNIAAKRVGKKAAGCLLDGREHKAFPAALVAPAKLYGDKDAGL